MPDFVAGPIARRKKNKTKYLVMWTAPILPDKKVSNDKILKFAGGMEHPAEHGDLEKTYREELKEETGLELRAGAPITRLITVPYPDHDKHFVLAWRRDCDGRLRQTQIADGNTMLYKPFFADKKYLEEYLHGDHRAALPFLT